MKMMIMKPTSDMPDMEDMHSKETEADKKEAELERILSENLRMIDTSTEFDKNGPYLSVSPEDNNPLHIEHHQAFIDNPKNNIRPQYKSRMEQHIKAHNIAENEKKRMGLSEDTSKEENQNTGDY